jgi:hypothetical protein
MVSGDPISYRQLQMLADALPAPKMETADPVAGRDLAYHRAIYGMDAEFEAVKKDPRMNAQQRAAAVRALNERYAALAMNSPFASIVTPEDQEQ